MRSRILGIAAAILALAALGLAALPAGGEAASITFSGTVSYQGSYTGDTLYVAALDTSGVEDVTLLDLQAYPVSAPPFSQPYSLTFDNTGVSPTLFIAALLDVDGGGIAAVSGEDIFGWYNEGTEPEGVSSSSTMSGLDFGLPRAEVHGTLTFASGQVDARINFTPSTLACAQDGFRPNYDITSEGAYSVNGLYPGTYCARAEGNTSGGYVQICYGDVTCASPTLITLAATEVRNGIDFDFAAVVPVQATTWGRIKSLYP